MQWHISCSEMNVLYDKLPPLTAVDMYIHHRIFLLLPVPFTLPFNLTPAIPPTHAL